MIRVNAYVYYVSNRLKIGGFMKAMKTTLRPMCMALLVAAAGLIPLAGQVHAQNATADMQARYKEDIQRCETLTDPESKQTCRREAGAALQAARHNRLTTPGDAAANATQRCKRLPVERRADCERLMSDSSTVEHGSVSGGGVFRELTYTVPADTATPGATPPAGSYSTQPAAPASSYGTQPAQPAPRSTYQAPAPTGTYGSQSAPAPAPAPGGYGTQPAR